tara:strand:+ start:379 stop:612 length:234 start_codon:yes stop_codon:yes gene_type:complete
MIVYAIRDATGAYVTIAKTMSKNKPPRLFASKKVAEGVVTQYNNGNGGAWTRSDYSRSSPKYPIEVVELFLDVPRNE